MGGWEGWGFGWSVRVWVEGQRMGTMYISYFLFYFSAAFNCSFMIGAWWLLFLFQRWVGVGFDIAEEDRIEEFSWSPFKFEMIW